CLHIDPSAAPLISPFVAAHGHERCRIFWPHASAQKRRDRRHHCGGGVHFASNGIIWLLGREIVSQFQVDIYRRASAASYLFWVWFTVVVAPIGEERLFRGFLFRG